MAQNYNPNARLWRPKRIVMKDRTGSRLCQCLKLGLVQTSTFFNCLRLNMRVPFLSDCENDFIQKSLKLNTRLDGRRGDEYRPLEVQAGSAGGSVVVRLGKTTVTASVACELAEPGSGRPTEGSVRVAVDLSPMGAPNWEAGRLGEEGVEVCRLLERVVRESGMVDVESLCVQAGQRVWEVRASVEILDEDGSLVDAASVAVLAALLLATRPDVSLKGDVLTLHPASDRDPVPINLYHHPVAVTIGFIDDGAVFVVDPTWREERVLQGALVFVFNTRKEICAMHSSGAAQLSKTLVMKCAAIAMQRALDVIEMVRKTVAEEKTKRKAGTSGGLVAAMGKRPEIRDSQGPTAVAAAASCKPSPSKTSSPPKPQVLSVRAGEVPLHQTSVPWTSPPHDPCIEGGVASLGASPSSRLMTERSPEEAGAEEAELVAAIQRSSTAAKEEPMDTADDAPKAKPKRKKKEPVDSLLDDISADVEILEPPKKEVITLDDDAEIDLTAAVKPKSARKKAKNRQK